MDVNAKAFANAITNANANTDAWDSKIALRERCSGKLKMVKNVCKNFKKAEIDNC